MWCRIVPCVVLGACGFQSAASGSGPHGGDDAAPPPPDGRGSGSGDASSGPIDCLQRWKDGTVALSNVQELAALRDPDTDHSDRDPWLSRDGKRLYFARSPGMKGLSDIYLASRGSTADEFGAAAGSVIDLINLNTADTEDRAALTEDETVLVLSRLPTGSGSKARIAITTRPDTTVDFGSPDERHLTNVNLDNTNHYDPFLNRDGLRLYLAPTSGPSGRQEIKVATRSLLGGDFVAPIDVAGINSSNTSNADPALSPDERVLVFSSDRGGGIDLYYATRPGLLAAFGTPRPIPGVNSAAIDGDPVLSDDGCELYFSSNRGGGSFHLFHAAVDR